MMSDVMPGSQVCRIAGVCRDQGSEWNTES